MENNKPSSFWKSYGLIVVIVGFVLVQVVVQNFNKSPKLQHSVVMVTSTIQEDDFQKARLILENSIFQNANSAISRNASLTYSEVLDSILPTSANVSNPPSGIIITIQNYGDATAHNLQVNLDLQTSIENYEIISSETYSVTNEDMPKGILKFSVGKLNPRDKIKIAILLSQKYAVLLTASRTGDLRPPDSSSTSDNPMSLIETLATQTAVADYNRNNVDNLLQFQVEYDIDKINPSVIVSSDECQSYLYDSHRNETSEQNLFIETFLK